MDYNNGIIVARKVIKLLERKPETKEFGVQCYANCREQGYKIKNYDLQKSVVITQDRNRDNIIVYWGGDQSFELAGNLPSEPVYQKRMSFKPDAFKEVAEFCFTFLTRG